MNKFGIDENLMNNVTNVFNSLSQSGDSQAHGIAKDMGIVLGQIKSGKFDESKLNELKDKYASSDNNKGV
jgi:hypothetical protein